MFSVIPLNILRRFLLYISSIVLGAFGYGTLSVLNALADSVGWDFYNADDFHPSDNVAKMTRRIPLGNSDRTLARIVIPTNFFLPESGLTKRVALLRAQRVLSSAIITWQ